MRFPWDAFKVWYSLPDKEVNYSTIERGTGLVQNFKTLEELYRGLSRSPTFKEDPSKVLGRLEVYAGKGIMVVDKHCMNRISKKWRKGNLDKIEKLYRDDHGGFIIIGKPFEFTAQLIQHYQGQEDGLPDSTGSDGDAAGRSEPDIQGGDKLPPTLSENKSGQEAPVDAS